MTALGPRIGEIQMECVYASRRQQFLKRLGPHPLDRKSIRQPHTANLSQTFIHAIRLFLQTQKMSVRVHCRHTDKKSSPMTSKVHLQGWRAWLYPTRRNLRFHCRSDGIHYFQSRPIPRTRGQLKYSASGNPHFAGITDSSPSLRNHPLAPPGN